MKNSKLKKWRLTAVGLFCSLSYVSLVLSQQSQEDLTVRITNPFPSPAEVFFVKSPGEFEKKGEVKANGFVKVQTRRGERWAFKVNGERVFPNFLVTAATRQNHRIGQGNSDVPNATPSQPMNNTPQPRQPVAPPSQQGAKSIDTTGSSVSTKDAMAMLELHNKARKEVGVAPLKWNSDIAAFAQKWANKLAQTGAFQHNPNRRTYGENIAAGSGAGATIVSLTDLWYKEKPLYRRGGPINAQNGHYTQMVWRGTTEIGAGVAKGRDGMIYLVCNYNPAGNMSGSSPY